MSIDIAVCDSDIEIANDIKNLIALVSQSLAVCRQNMRLLTDNSIQVVKKTFLKSLHHKSWAHPFHGRAGQTVFFRQYMPVICHDALGVVYDPFCICLFDLVEF